MSMFLNLEMVNRREERAQKNGIARGNMTDRAVVLRLSHTLTRDETCEHRQKRLQSRRGEDVLTLLVGEGDCPAGKGSPRPGDFGEDGDPSL